MTEIRSEIRDFRQATTSSFNAMREDLNDLRQYVDNGFAEMRVGFAEMRAKLDASAAGHEQVVNLLNTMIDQQGQQRNGD